MRPSSKSAPVAGSAGAGEKLDVVVIGAGIAGLVAARELDRLGLGFAVVEAHEEVGGRTRNTVVDGTTIDLGGTFVGPDQERILALGNELGLTLAATHHSGDNVIYWRGRRRRFSGTVPSLDPATLISLAFLRARLERLRRSVPLGEPWAAPRARALDAQTLGSWMTRLGITPGARDLIRVAVQVSWGCEPDEVSLLHVLHYLHGTGGFDSMLDIEGGAQESHFVEGAHEICRRLAEPLGDRLRLGAPVLEVEWEEGGAAVHTADGTLRARRVVVALSPSMRALIRFTPHLPNPWCAVPRRWFQGPVSKAYAIYERPFWRQAGLSGEGIADCGPVNVTLDAGAPGESRGILLGFVAADHARAWDGLPASERRAQALSSFAALFGEQALNPIEYLDHRWMTEPWIGGGSVAAAPPLAWTTCGRGIAEPIGPLHWAGTETSGRWGGFMEGAVRSGERVVQEIVAGAAAHV